MFQTLLRNWWLLALCGVLDALIAVVYFVMGGTDGPLLYHSWNGTIALLGKLTLAAGICTIAAGIWRSTTGKSWLLALNGLALCALGLVYYTFVRYSIGIRTIALLMIVLAVSAGMVEWAAARGLRRQHHIADGWLLSAASVGSVGFAVPFLALGLQWIRLVPGSHVDLLWFGAYFAFSAISMLGLALRLHGSSSEPREIVPPFGTPKHAH